MKILLETSIIVQLISIITSTEGIRKITRTNQSTGEFSLLLNKSHFFSLTQHKLILILLFSSRNVVVSIPNGGQWQVGKQRVEFPLESLTSRNVVGSIPNGATGGGLRGGWGNVLQARISRVRFPVASMVTNWIKINMCCVRLNKYGLFTTNPILRQLDRSGPLTLFLTAFVIITLQADVKDPQVVHFLYSFWSHSVEK